MSGSRIGRAVAVAAALAGAAFAAAGASVLASASPRPAPAAHAAGTHTVVLSNIAFHPSTLNIRRGESVRWVWRDGGEEHNVTFSRSTRSRTMASGSFTLRFTRPGTFRYICTIHVESGMRGRVVVH